MQYYAELIASAEEQKLWQERTWHILLSYVIKENGFQSEARGDRFFLSKTGKNNPQAELIATIKAFFQENRANPDEQAQCLFPARYRWLKERLHFNPARLPQKSCPRLEAHKKDAGLDSISFVFAGYFLSAPASMFGHAFLKLNSKSKPDFLNLVLNYSMQGPQNMGVFNYFYGGLSGKFEGKFSLFPYYLKVKEYSDLESRDLWHYELALTKEERLRLFEHAWELSLASFDYYFLDKNCAYRLLALLETARTSLRLREETGAMVAPGEVIKLLHKSGLVSMVYYQPSLESELRMAYVALTDPEKKIMLELLDSASAYQPGQSPTESDRRILEALLLALRLRTEQNRLTETQRSLQKEALLFRSQQNTAPAFSQIPMSTPPEFSHNLGLISAGGGALDVPAAESGKKNISFLELAIRPFYHDLQSQPDGFAPGSQIEFMHARLRFSTSKDRPYWLEELNLLGITALEPYDRISGASSYSLGLGFFTAYEQKEASQLEQLLFLQSDITMQAVYYHHFGRNSFVALDEAGQVFDLFALYGYTLGRARPEPWIQASVLAGARARQSYSTHRAQAGPEIALVLLLGHNNLRARIDLAYCNFGASGGLDERKAELGLSYTFRKNHELRASLETSERHRSGTLKYVVLY